MKTIILAAGGGGRLRGIVGQRSKCLARVGDSTLLDRQLRILRDHGCSDITVVVGFGAAEVTRACGSGVSFVQNTRFAATNSLYSLWLARDLLRDGFLVLNCDVLFHPQLLTDLLSARCDDALLYAEHGDGAPYSAEEMKVCVRGGLVRAIDKTLPAALCDGENIGIARFSPAGASTLVDHLNELVAGGSVREWLPRAFDAFCHERPLHAIGTRGYPWIEIDFPEDYWRACGDVLPAIEETSSSCMSASTTFASGLSR
jgi:choline kinase